MYKNAIISECRKFRYTLTRMWEENDPQLLIVMLNPSSADDRKDDPTIRHLIERCKREYFGGFRVVNLYAYRSSCPQDLIAHLEQGDEVVGKANNQAILEMANECDEVLFAWGCNPIAARRDKEVIELLRDRFEGGGNRVWMIALTKDGFPRHPLYSKYADKMIPYVGRHYF